MPQPSEEIAFLIDLESREATALPEATLQSVGLKERADLQRWITEHPKIMGPDLLLITTEFDRWEIREQRVPDRLDMLFLDSAGSPLVAELKRDRAADTTDLQALKYAAYCSRLTVQDLVEEFARFHGVGLDEARSKIIAHAAPLAEGEPGRIRIQLVAGSFGPAVTTVVLWLRDLDLDIGCIQLTARNLGDGKAMLSARQLLPPPQAEDYLVGRRHREREEEARKVGARGANSIKVLAEARALKAGDILTLNMGSLLGKWRPNVEHFLATAPHAAEAEWTGDPIPRSLRWRYDDEVYSATGLTKRLLALAGIEVGVVAGPDHWNLPDGRPMYRASVEIRTASESRVTEI